MAEPIGPGDWVECAPPPGYRGEVGPDQVTVKGNYPKPGGVYCVREVGEYGCPLSDGLRLVGVVVSYGRHADCWFPAAAFRPIYRPRASFIESLKAPPKRAPKRQREDA